MKIGRKNLDPVAHNLGTETEKMEVEILDGRE